jgi:hypothetical protein
MARSRSSVAGWRNFSTPGTRQIVDQALDMRIVMAAQDQEAAACPHSAVAVEG